MKESTALPTLDELRETTTCMDMVKWLTACPLALFVSHGHEILAICEEAGFEAGVTYCTTLIAALHRTRTDEWEAYCRVSDSHGLNRHPGDALVVLSWLHLHSPHGRTGTKLLAGDENSPRIFAEGASATACPSACEAPSGASGDSRDSARTQS